MDSQFISYSVKPIISDFYPHIFETAIIPVRATSIERTFWEKAAILHREANRPKEKHMPLRYSRHYYDIVKIFEHYQDDILDSVHLFNDVMEFNEKFYYTSWARYKDALQEGLKLLPPAYRHDELRHDYKTMEKMIYGKKPDFDSLLTDIAFIEAEVNASVLEDQESPSP